MKSKDIAIVGILLAIGAILRYFLDDAPYSAHAEYDHRVLLSCDHPYPAKGIRSTGHRDCRRVALHADLKFHVPPGKPGQ